MADVSLTWRDPNSNNDGHRIYRDTTPLGAGDPQQLVADLGPDVTSYIDTGLAAGSTYYYVVTAYTNDGLEEEALYIRADTI